MIQVAEHLPNKCKALSSNPNTAKKDFIFHLVVNGHANQVYIQGIN
jgi:hypothetical protein